jgi:regulator of protease activity HflC (stomatin/prohibitin superfamily)
MLVLKYLLLVVGIGLFGSAAAVLAYDVYLAIQLERLLRRAEPGAAPPARRSFRWRLAGRLVALGVLPLLVSLSIALVPDGMAGVRVSQISGVLPETLYPGVHFVVPLVERVALFDLRDHIYFTAAAAVTAAPATGMPATPAMPAQKAELLEVEAREGLRLGLAVAVRYRLDPRRLAYIQSTLPQPIEQQIVAPVVTSAFRDVAPNYLVREVFATKRGEFRDRATALITQKLAADGIDVKEVMLRRVQLPPEYARGLEGLLLKEQEDERMGVETDIQQKQVRIAELQAEAAKIRQVKRAEAEADSRVIYAKAQSDAMKYTLPLKQKEIEQSRLEAEARKEATIQNAEADAQAKVIDGKAELERRKLMAQAEAARIQLTSAAEAQELALEGQALRANPLLIQKIVAERLSDKVRIMMVPTDGKFFFASDVLRGAPLDEPAANPPKDPTATPDASSRPSDPQH